MRVFKTKFNDKEVVKLIVKPKVEVSKEYQPKHIVHILDRSGSMSGEIRNLIEDVKKSITLMNDQDLLSVIWFSSANQAKILLKGANKNTPNINKMLDSIASTVGLTCFSYPLELLTELIEETKILCPIFSVTLFTDGEAVVNWSVEEETRRCIAEIKKNTNDIIAFNTVGYGYYYNEEFLKSLSSLTPLGRQFHAKQIDEYKDIWNSNYKMINNCVLQNLKIEAPDSDIIIINNDEYNIVKDSFVSNVIGQGENVFYIITENASLIKIDGHKLSNYEDFEIDDDFKYTIAYQYYMAGNNIGALEILGSDLKDIYLTNKMMNSFTFNEKQEMKDILKEAVLSSTSRYIEGKGAKKLLPKKKAFCVIDLLKILYTNSAYYIPSKNYNKISFSNTERVSNVIKDEDSYLGSFRTLSFNKTKMNISIDYMYNVDIGIDDADGINLSSDIVAKGFGKQSIIKDGILNMNKITVAIPPQVLNDLNKNVKVTFIGNKEIEGKVYTVVEMDLTKLPIINMSLNEMSFSDFMQEFKKMNWLKNKVKNLRQEAKESRNDVYYLFKDLTDSELDLLKTKYHVSRQGWFSEPYAKGVKKEKVDYYEAKELEITCADEIEVSGIDVDNRKELQDRIAEIELDLMGCKIARLSIGNLWNNLTDLGKGKYSDGDVIIKTKKTKVYY